MDYSARIESQIYRDKVISAEKAASCIQDGMTVSVPHFICYDSPVSTARAVLDRKLKGENFQVDLVSAAACHPVIDQGWTEAGIVRSFMPYTSANSSIRKSANRADGLYFKDYRLSVIPEYMRMGYLGDIDVALVSVAGITADGKLKPSVCAGYTQTVLNCAKKVILEINLQSAPDMYLLHDVYDPGDREGRQPIPITKANDVILSLIHISSHGKGSPQRKLRTPFLRLAALSRERRLPVSGVSETKGDRGEGSTSRPPAGSETANKSRESCR